MHCSTFVWLAFISSALSQTIKFICVFGSIKLLLLLRSRCKPIKLGQSRTILQCNQNCPILSPQALVYQVTCICIGIGCCCCCCLCCKSEKFAAIFVAFVIVLVSSANVLVPMTTNGELNLLAHTQRAPIQFARVAYIR